MPGRYLKLTRNLIGSGKQTTLLLVIICVGMALLDRNCPGPGAGAFSTHEPGAPGTPRAGGAFGRGAPGRRADVGGYATERWEASPVRTVAVERNSLPDDAPAVTQQSILFCQLRPFLERDGRLQAAGVRRTPRPAPGHAGRGTVPLPRGAGRWQRYPGLLDQSGRCQTRVTLDKWRIWDV